MIREKGDTKIPKERFGEVSLLRWLYCVIFSFVSAESIFAHYPDWLGRSCWQEIQSLKDGNSKN